jgi:type II secretory pathway component PulM
MHMPATLRNWSPLLLGTVVVLLGLILWLQIPQPALAQSPPDAGAQRLEMIKQLETMNAKLGEIAGLLREIRDDARKGHAELNRPKRP